MAESYLYNVIILKHTYSHSNGVKITTGLWALDNFEPQVHIVCENSDLFFTLEEWKHIYKEFELFGKYVIDDCFYRYFLYRLMFCDKRCSVNMLYLVCEALNIFAHCIDLRLRSLTEKDYIEATMFVKNIEQILKHKFVLSLNDILMILNTNKCVNSIVEQEISTLAANYFLRYLYK